MTTQIERRGDRSPFGLLLLWAFLLWNAFMAFALVHWVAVAKDAPIYKLLTTDEQRNAFVGGGVASDLFIWSVSALVLGTFVVWTRGPRILMTMEE
jgi:hypothetical protein